MKQILPKTNDIANTKVCGGECSSCLGRLAAETEAYEAGEVRAINLASSYASVSAARCADLLSTARLSTLAVWPLPVKHCQG